MVKLTALSAAITAAITLTTLAGMVLPSHSWATSQLPTMDDIPPDMLEEARLITDQAAAASKAYQGDAAWIEELGKNILENAPQILAGEPVAPVEPAPQQQEIKHPLGEGEKAFVFVSLSMGNTAIRNLLNRYHGETGIALVFRGIPAGMSMAEGAMRIQSLSMETQSDIPVLIDPVAFRSHGITAVPSVAIETPKGGTLIKVTGLDSVDYLREALAEGKSGHLGHLGPTNDISEQDMIELAEQRIAELDFEEMKQRAVDNFWHQQTGHALPQATEDARRTVDPTVLIPEDILDLDGNVVTPAGRINPLDIMPFDQKLVVIDPTKQWQRQLARHEVASAAGQIVTVIATQIDPDQGWDLFTSTEDEIDAALYLLQPHLANRFQILRTPSVVTADERTFIIHEYTEATVQELILEAE